MPLLSFAYPLFLMAVCSLYWCVPARGRVHVLWASGLAFCAAWHPLSALLLLLSTGIEYGIGLRLGWERPKRVRVRWLWVALLFNLGSLVAFRYVHAVAGDLAPVLQTRGAWLDTHTLQLVSSAGLSFYTLQRMTHTFDVYYRRMEPCRSFASFLAFVGFFPLLASGPIERAPRLLPQLGGVRCFRLEDLWWGAWLLTLGLFKKVYIADHLGPIQNQLLDPEGPPSSSSTVLGIYVYSFFVYADFAAYSDMARGTARLLGIDVMENFRAPYLSASLSEFWGRWHISLSSFLDDYLYRPAAMFFRNLGNAGIVLATFITFAISAAWHGTGLTFLAWGALHAGGLSLLVLSKKPRKRLAKRAPARLWHALSVAATFHVVCLGYVFFRAPTLAAALALFDHVASYPLGITSASAVIAPALGYTSVLILLDLWQARAGDSPWIFQRPLWLRTVCYAAMLMCILRFHAPTEPFVYVQF